MMSHRKQGSKNYDFSNFWPCGSKKLIFCKDQDLSLKKRFWKNGNRKPQLQGELAVLKFNLRISLTRHYPPFRGTSNSMKSYRNDERYEKFLIETRPLRNQHILTILIKIESMAKTFTVILDLDSIRKVLKMHNLCCISFSQ